MIKLCCEKVFLKNKNEIVEVKKEILINVIIVVKLYMYMIRL